MYYMYVKCILKYMYAWYVCLMFNVDQFTNLPGFTRVHVSVYTKV